MASPDSGLLNFAMQTHSFADQTRSSEFLKRVSALDSYEISYRLPLWSELRRAYRDYKDIKFEDEDTIKNDICI